MPRLHVFFEQIEALNGLIEQTLLRVSDLDTRRQSQASFFVENSASLLEALAKRYDSSLSDATGITSRYEAITRSMGGIVASLQFHDITRQRIEHAGEALLGVAGSAGGEGEAGRPEGRDGNTKESVRAEFRENEGKRAVPSGDETSPENGESLERLGVAGAVRDLQVAQLRGARDAMVGAVENVLENLGKVAVHVGEISMETARMAGAQGGRSFLSEVEAGFPAIVSAFGAYTAVARELSSIVGSVGGALGDMSAAAGGIEGIGHKIKLIALNAIVKACHIGHAGKTLSMLAETIHELSVETRELTETVGGALRSMSSETQALDAVIEGSGEEKGDDAGSVRKTFDILVENLEAMSRRAHALLVRLNEEGNSLSDDILMTVEKVEVHRRVEAAIEHVTSRLEEIASAARPFNSRMAESPAVERLRALEASYSMGGERAVHRLATRGADSMDCDRDFSRPADPGAGVDEGAQDGEGQEDFGDNVELF
jgi:hypothetical protein